MVNIKDTSQWTVLVAIVAALGWGWQNLASAADITRIESNQLRGEVRDMCYKYVTAPPAAKDMVGRFVMDATREMCALNGDDPRCQLLKPEEVCGE